MEGKWRNVGHGFRRAFQEATERKLWERLLYGAREHGPNFKGEPLDELEEEALDILVYAAVAKAQLQEKEERIRELEARLKVYEQAG